CPAVNGHIQAVGTDAAGRRQYLYHPLWRERRDQEKFDRMLVFARALPKVRRVTSRHLRTDGMSRERSLACAVRLLDRGFFRIGGETYAEENGSYGLATLRKKHVSLDLGNTPAVCRKSYIDPRVVDHFDSGDTVAWVLGKLAGDIDSPEVQPMLERAVVELLSDAERPRQSHPAPALAA